ncbi:MAG: TetR/AcrR family transcriptional regulator [Spirosomataceae bacterium]
MRNKDEEKVKLILEAALNMVARVGLSGLKMSDLAKEAGVATGTIYLYFEDKEQLIREVYGHLVRHASSDLSEGVANNDPLKISINKMTRNYLNDSIKNPAHSAFLEQYFRSPYVEKEEKIRLEETKTLQPLYALVKEGQRQGLIKEADTDWLVMLICGLLNEVARQVIYTRKPLIETEWELTFGVLWDGIKG